MGKMARRWAGKRWWKVDQATRDRLRRKHTRRLGERGGAIGGTTALEGRRADVQSFAELTGQTVASLANRSGRWAAAEASKISDAECAGPATKQEPQEFIGCVGDFGLYLKPPRK
jgi:hypothetical protein